MRLMRRFGFEMKRLTITLTHGLMDPGTIDLQAAVTPGRPSRCDSLQQRRFDHSSLVKSARCKTLGTVYLTFGLSCGRVVILRPSCLVAVVAHVRHQAANLD